MAARGGVAACRAGAAGRKCRPLASWDGHTFQHGQWIAAFVQRMRELGWIEGRNIAIEYRWAEGRSERFIEFVAEFVRSKVDVIVTGGNAVPAAKHATSVIPIVFAVAVDPVGSGFSLACRDQEATSPACRASSPILLANGSDFCAKSFPDRRRLAIMVNVGYPAPRRNWLKFRPAAGTLGFEVARIGNPASGGYRARLRGLNAARRPSMSLPMHSYPTEFVSTPCLGAHGCRRSWAPAPAVQAGGLMFYGPNFSDLFRRAADFDHKILARRRSPAISRSNSRPSSISSSISRQPRRSASAYTPCSRPLMK